jgi:predicted ATPase
VIIKSFVARNVYGYLNFKIEFNEDINFLVGVNGSGKTTALRLMNALCTPSFKDLIQIPFDYAEITINDNGKNYEISAMGDSDNKNLKINTIKSVLTIPNLAEIELDYYSSSDKQEEIINDIARKNAEHEIVKEISKIRSPIFLGLDRRKDDIDRSKEDYFFEREMWYRNSNKRAIRAKRLIKGSLGISLMETELLVQNNYRRIREIDERRSTELRDTILLSAFQYIDIKLEDLNPDTSSWKEREGLLKRQMEIKDALLKIGIGDSKLSNEVDNFFNRLTNLFEQLNAEGEGFSLVWLLNKAQIDKMYKIVEIIDEHKSKIDGLFKPITEFLKTVNNFYEDSYKILEIDTVGQLVVRRPDNTKCTIEGLSSGERQLLIIFAHAFFNRYNNRSTTFIIDEPELSLHLGWQEKFAETIFSISPSSQFILATHSPEIVGMNKQKAVGCR